MKYYNNLSPDELERLALLSEELGEAQQIIGKILRHGVFSYNPNDEERTPNWMLLEKELGDIFAAIDMMDDAGDIKFSDILDFKEEKLISVKKYLHHQEVE